MKRAMTFTLALLMGSALAAGQRGTAPATTSSAFALEEATIRDVHHAFAALRTWWAAARNVFKYPIDLMREWRVRLEIPL